MSILSSSHQVVERRMGIFLISADGAVDFEWMQPYRDKTGQSASMASRTVAQGDGWRS